MKFCRQARVELTRTTWPIMNTADSPTQVWDLLLQLTSYPWDFGDFRKCRSPWLVLELYLPLASFPARFGPFNRPRCLLYTYLHSMVILLLYYIQSEVQKVLQSDRTQTIDHIQKGSRQRFQCSRRPSYWTILFLLSVEALKLRQGQLQFLKWNHVFFFDDIITDFKTNSATYNTRSF